MDNGVASLAACFAQLSLTSCVPETAAAAATAACSNNVHSNNSQ